MSFPRRLAHYFVSMTLFCLMIGGPLFAEDFFLADGESWPGKILRTSDRGLQEVHLRSQALPQGDVPRIRSITLDHDGNLVFCSGLDRSLMKLLARGEVRFQHGGYLVRQVRTDTDGTIYFSGLETPLQGNPLPDGFIYRVNPASGRTETLSTFSQSDTQHDWWGSFDVREGHIYVSTFHEPSTIYDLSVVPPRALFTVPFGVHAFRFESETSILACDGRGKLVRFPDLHHPEKSQIVLDLPTAFVDFCQAR